MLSQQVPRKTFVETSKGRVWVALGARTLVRVTQHTQPHLHYYGAGCYITPVDEKHKWHGREFYLSNSELHILRIDGGGTT